jgi:hypothetical protein
MKPLRDLTIDDLHMTPVWQSLGGADEEALVVPTRRTTLSESDQDTFLAVTEFVLGNGQRHLGFCSPTDDSGLDYVQPVIVTTKGQVTLWFHEPPSQGLLADQWSRLGVPETDVFPIKYECPVPVDGRTVKGTIPDLKSMGGVA